MILLQSSHFSFHWRSNIYYLLPSIPLGIFYQNGTIKPYLQDLTLGCSDGNVFPSAPTTPTATIDNNTSTIAPTLAPIIVNTTNSTATEFPTSAPTLPVGDTPTTIPTSTIVPTESPTAIASDTPTSSPTLSLTSEIGTESFVPSEVPSDVPSSQPYSSLCSLNPLCSALNLTGECCPTPGGDTLLCCGTGVVEEFCENNNRCVDYELNDGMCCPTSHADIPEIDNKYLDCCGVIPDECQIDINKTEAENSKCEFMSTVDYKLLYEQFKRDAARSGATVIVTTSTTLFWMTIIISVMTSYSMVIQP